MAITLELERVPNVAARLQAYPDKATRALVRALNRGINSAQTFMAQKLAKDLGMKNKDVREKLVLQEANKNRLSARLAASLNRIPIMDFNARQTSRGVSYKLAGSRGFIPSAFIATMGSGHTGVFVRAGRKRLPIDERFGPSIGHVFAKYQAAGLARAQEMMAKNLEHELQFAATEDAGV